MSSIPRDPIDHTRNLPILLEAPSSPPPPQPQSRDDNASALALAANILITLIIITALMVDGTQAKTAIIAGSIYFCITTLAFALVTTGALSSMVNAHQHELTERRRILAYHELGRMHLLWRIDVERARVLEPVALPERTAAHHALSPLGQAKSYVAPYVDEQGAATEAIAWAEALYEADAMGAPNPRKVHLAGESIGRLKIRMIGSKRGSGSREAGLWLIHQGVIVRVSGGYALALEHFPYRHYLSNLRP